MTSAQLAGAHDLPLVALSIAIAIAASYSALDLAGRVRASSGRTSLLWLGAAAVAMGGGIWAMHFVAMLAFIFPLPVAHDLRLTAISLVLPIIVTGLGFAVVRRRAGRKLDIALGGLLMGGGIAAMHYTGMAAMRVPAELRYDALYVTVSVLIAIGASTSALWLALRDSGLPIRIGAAIAMGVAVAGMHYTAMAGAHWVQGEDPSGAHRGHAAHGLSAIQQGEMATGVAAATFLLLSLALVAALIDRRFAALSQREAALALRESEARAGVLAAERAAILGQLAEGVIVTDLAGRITFVNEAAARIHGGARLLGVLPEAYSAAYGLRTEQGDPHPPAELPLARAVLRGETVEDARWRIRRPDGTEVLAVGSARPVRGPDGAPLGAVLTLRDETARNVAEAALRESEARLRLAQEATGTGVWEWDPAADTMVWTPELYALLGLDPEGENPPSIERFLATVHPEDRPAMEAAARAAVEAGALEAEFRVVCRRGAVEETRWLLSRARRVRDAGGSPGRFLGVNIDITERKAAEECQALLTRELDHRSKNALAVVQAALRLTPRDDAETYARAVEGRVAALARAHTLLAAGRWEGASLHDLIESELVTFLPTAEMAAVPRVELEGPEVVLAPAATQALSMALHELATNATKHGALGVASGRVAVFWHVNRAAGQLCLRWEEQGGPAASPPTRRGFGSRVIEATMRGQLGGTVERRWLREGLVCIIEVPIARAAAGAGRSKLHETSAAPSF